MNKEGNSFANHFILMGGLRAFKLLQKKAPHFLRGLFFIPFLKELLFFFFLQFFFDLSQSA